VERRRKEVCADRKIKGKLEGRSGVRSEQKRAGKKGEG
jgi:hypothetical protein